MAYETESALECEIVLGVCISNRYTPARAHHFAQDLAGFLEKHPAAEQPMRSWHSIVEKTDFTDFHDLCRSFGSADYARPYTIFDIGGNNWRIVSSIHYNTRKVFVRWVMTHDEYDSWRKRYAKGKV